MDTTTVIGDQLSNNFLAHIFHPSKNPRPTGLRRHHITWRGIGKSRKTSRIRAFNRMTPVQQRVIEAVDREAYLRGQLTLAEAKRRLRPYAIQRGIAKPLKSRAITGPDERTVTRRRYEQLAIQNILTVAEYRDPFKANGYEKNPISRQTVEHNVKHVMRNAQVKKAATVSYDELLHEATKDSINRAIDFTTGEIINPWWYH